MATAMIYDTLKLAEQLEHEAGFDAARARAIAHILADNTGGNLVTREDLLITAGKLEGAVEAARSDLETKIGGLEGRIGSLQGRIGGLEGRIGGLEGRIGGLEGRIGGLEGRIGGLGGRIGGLEGKVGEVQGDIRVLYWITGTTLAGVATLLGTAVTIALHIMHLG